MGANLPANLPNIDEIESGFNQAVDLFRVAFDKIEEAETAISAARAAIEVVTPGAGFHHERDAREVEEFHKAVQLPSRDVYLRTAHKLLTLRCWHYVIERCGLDHLMDAQAKQELYAQLRYVPERSKHDRELITEEEAEKGPPPFTADTVRSTIATFAGNAGTYWRRGIASVFSRLDRRFRSHDGFKVGGRLILTRLVDDSGYVDLHRNISDQFKDIERTFQILDGRDPRHARSGFLRQIKDERSSIGLGWKVGPSEHENDYFKVRIYKNGNAHLWFTRDDLVQKVNLELAAYYGEVIGDGQTREPDPLESRAVTHARNFGFFPTPPEVAGPMIRKVPWHRGSQRILEPSAGTGNLAFLLAKPLHQRDEKTVRHLVDAIELQPDLATALRNSGRLNRVTTGDFLTMPPTPIYDGVVMNPPFDRERDIDHVTHAMKFLKPGGWLLSIMSAGVEFRETRKAAAFRKLLDERKGWMIDIPSGSFASVGTYVNTVLAGFGMPNPRWFE